MAEFSTTPAQEVPERFQKYDLEISDPKKTGLRLYTLTDKKTGVAGTFAEFNPDFDVHAGIAWVGARTSRSSDSYPAIFEEINTAIGAGRYTAGDKLADVFVNYGHASVADMAPVMLFFNNIPMHIPFRVFNQMSLGAGQELSTRYVELTDLGVPDVGRIFDGFETPEVELLAQIEWKALQTQMVENYNKWFERLQPALGEYLDNNFDGEVKPSTLTTRALDVARMWIPAGAKTSQTALASVRQWVDIAGQLRINGDVESAEVGNLIIDLLSLGGHPECLDIKANLSALTRHSEGSPTVQDNVQELREHLGKFGEFQGQQSKIRGIRYPESGSTELILPFEYGSQTMAFNYILQAYPEMHPSIVLDFVQDLGEDELREISNIIFKGHNQFDPLRSAADVRGPAFVYESSLAYMRDINRHRSFGRLVLSLEVEDFNTILDGGWNRNHAIHNAEYWKQFAEEWEADWAAFYKKFDELRDFLESELGTNYKPKEMINMLPLGHQIRMVLSAPAGQWSYMTSLRVGLGGDFGYREDVWNMLEALRNSDPGFSGMASHLVKPDVNNPGQIVGRS